MPAADGLDGDPRAALKARFFLREWFGGRIRLEPLAAHTGATAWVEVESSWSPARTGLERQREAGAKKRCAHKVVDDSSAPAAEGRWAGSWLY
jgi:hypothetical protein